MALFKSQIVTQASGSVGGLTFSHNKSGMYMRGRRIPVNPATSKQVIVRNALAVLVSRWTGILTPTQRASWEAYAGNVQTTTPIGDSTFISGQSWYISTNTLRQQGGFSIADTGPSIFTRASLTSPGVTSVTATTGIAIVTFTNTDAWATNGGLMMWGSPPVSPATNFYAGPYNYVGRILGAGTPPTSPQNMPAWPFPLVAGQKVFFYFRAINSAADARTSAMIRGSIVTV